MYVCFFYFPCSSSRKLASVCVYKSVYISGNVCIGRAYVFNDVLAVFGRLQQTRICVRVRLRGAEREAPLRANVELLQVPANCYFPNNVLKSTQASVW